MKQKIIFMGTPKIAEEVLSKLINSEYRPELVITQKDKPVGRKQDVLASPAKLLAEKNNIETFTPDSLKEESVVKKIKDFNPDVIIVVAYGKIIPQSIIDIPKFGVLNIHASLLPKYRGASPIQHAILSGDKITGVTLMQIDEKMDHGPMLAKKEVEISDIDTTETLSEKLSEAGSYLLLEVLPDLFLGKIKPKEQEHEKATLAKILKKEDGEVKEEQTAKEIERMSRAFYPWPGIYLNLKLKDKELKLKLTKIALAECEDKKDKLYLNKDKKLILNTKDGCLELIEVQPESKNKMSGEAFYQGYRALL